jgi:flagellar FliL protein
MAATTTTLPEPDLEETEEPRGRSKRKLVLLLVAVLVVAGAAWWLLGRGGDEEADAEPVEGLVVEVAQMTVNLAGEDLHYVRFAFALVLAADVLPGDVERRFALLKDAALSSVQSFTEAELRTPEGTDRLRAELTRHAHDVYADGRVVRVVLTELLVQ